MDVIISVDVRVRCGVTVVVGFETGALESLVLPANRALDSICFAISLCHYLLIFIPNVDNYLDVP